MWIIYVLLGIGSLAHFGPKIHRAIDSYGIRLIFNKLTKSGYKVIKNDPTGDIKADYLILSRYGLHIIKRSVFTKRNTFCLGNELQRTWTYYEPYLLNPKAPSGGLYEGSPGNANRFEIYNPILELEEGAKKLGSIIQLETKEIPMFPIVLIIPKIKAINITRKPKSRTHLVFSDMLYQTITDKDTIVLSSDEVNRIEHILSEYIRAIKLKDKSKP